MKKLWAYIGAEDELKDHQKMALPPKKLTDEEKLPIGTMILIKEDLNRFWKQGFYIVIGYSPFGFYGSVSEWGHKEVHSMYCQESMLETSMELNLITKRCSFSNTNIKFVDFEIIQGIE